MADRLFNFTTKMTGVSRVNLMLKASIDAFGAILAKKQITKMVLRQTQDRFKPAGTNRNAQRSPVTGQYWPKLADSTRRVKNKNKSHKLVDKDKLRKAIVIARDSLNSATRANVGIAEVAVRHVVNRQTTKAGKIHTKYTDEYGKIHQEGNATTPARAFIGVTKADAAEVSVLMTATFNRFTANFG